MPELMHNPWHYPTFARLLPPPAAGPPRALSTPRGSASAPGGGDQNGGGSSLHGSNGAAAHGELPPFFRAVAPALIRPHPAVRAVAEEVVAALWPSAAPTVGLQVPARPPCKFYLTGFNPPKIR